jgi:hypothetical protein
LALMTPAWATVVVRVSTMRTAERAVRTTYPV